MSVLDAFLIENRSFVNYETEHLICFVGSLALISYYLYQGRNKWDEDKQRKYITIICLAGAFTQLFKVGYRLYDGSFNPGEDMPLHLCNMMVLVMPLIMWTKSKIWWGITFFWIMAGCAQSIFTPTLTESLPHYEAVRYWLVHAVIILGALYGLIVYRFDLTFMDALRSAIGLNLLAALIFPVNIWLNANYMYLNGKPPGQTFYDLLGPWPDYILVLEFVVIVFFGGILYLVRKLRARPVIVK
jgi:hypothetical integral membrane protein (TIGR02206 family)